MIKPCDFSSNNHAGSDGRKIANVLFIAFPQLPADIWTELLSAVFPARPYLEHVFVKGSKFDRHLSFEVALTCSVNVMKSAGQKKAWMECVMPTSVDKIIHCLAESLITKA